mgnify:CR=1 FL=1
MEGNAEVWEVLELGGSQLRFAGMGSAIGFDFNALKTIADDCGVDTSRAFWSKIRAVEGCIVKKANKDKK